MVYQQPMTPSVRSTPPIAPILIVMILLTPMHLSASFQKMMELPQETLPSLENQISKQFMQSKKPSFATLEQNTSKEYNLRNRTPEALFSWQSFKPNSTDKLHFDNIPRSQIALGEQFSSKSSFDPIYNPIFRTITKKKVLFLSEKSTSGRAQNVIFEGLRRSKWIQWVHTVALNDSSIYKDIDEDLWIHDFPSSVCSSSALQKYAAQQSSRHIPVLQLDFTERTETSMCSDLPALFGSRKRIRHAKRSIVQGRSFNITERWINTGNFVPNGDPDAPILHAPYPIRSDHVKSLVRWLFNHTGLEPSKVWDVSHWGGTDSLRSEVHSLCRSLQGKSLPSGATLRTYCSREGPRGLSSVRQIDREETYASQLWKSRIVIVTQRDHSEDHYRLMEALASGAMVITDFMLSLPKGLVNRESIVMVQSRQELIDAIMYYADHEDDRASIARRGWETAMGRHRSWHRIEELLFGRPLTDVDNPYRPFQRSTPLHEV